MIRIGLGLAALGMICLLAFHRLGSHVDAQGVLHEPFFLLPVGYALLVCGVIAGVAGGVRRARARLPR